MTAKKTAKPKTFWAVRPNGCDDVEIFPAAPRLSEGAWGWFSWTASGTEGGCLCYRHFKAITGITLERDVPVRVAFTARVVK